MQGQKKKLFDWAEGLNEEVKAKIIENSNAKRLKKPYKTFREALRAAFIWADSPEGHKYWSDVVKEFEKNQLEKDAEV